MRLLKSKQDLFVFVEGVPSLLHRDPLFERSSLNCHEPPNF